MDFYREAEDLVKELEQESDDMVMGMLGPAYYDEQRFKAASVIKQLLAEIEAIKQGN